MALENAFSVKVMQRVGKKYMLTLGIMFFGIQILKTFLTHLAATYCLMLPHIHTCVCGGSGWFSGIRSHVLDWPLILSTSPPDYSVAKTQHFGAFLSYPLI